MGKQGQHQPADTSKPSRSARPRPRRAAQRGRASPAPAAAAATRTRAARAAYAPDRTATIRICDAGYSSCRFEEHCRVCAGMRRGSSGWQYDSWKGPLYPPMSQRQWLEYFAARFPVVEVNNTFYQLPNHGSKRGTTRLPGTSSSL